MSEAGSPHIKALIDAAADGRIHECGDFPKDDEASWAAPGPGQGPVFSAQKLRDLLLGPLLGPSTESARVVLLGLRGAVVEGDLDLRELGGHDGQPLPPLILEYCRFSGEIILSNTHLQRLSLKGSRFVRLEAAGCQIEGDVDIDGIASCEYDRDEDNPLISGDIFKNASNRSEASRQVNGSEASPDDPAGSNRLSDGPMIHGRKLGLCSVNLMAARIDGTVRLHGAKLCGSEPEDSAYPAGKRPYALNLGVAEIGGNLGMQPGFVAVGGVMLAHARITGSVWLGGSRIRALGALAAIDAQSLHVGDHFQLRAVEIGTGENKSYERFECIGEASFLSARIGGELRIAGGVFQPLPAADRAPGARSGSLLTLWMAKIGGVMVCSESNVPTLVYGPVVIESCEVEHSVIIQDTWLLSSPRGSVSSENLFTHEKLGPMGRATLWLSQTRIRGDLKIPGAYETLTSGWGNLCRIEGGISANKLRVDGEVLLLDLDIGADAAEERTVPDPQDQMICNFSEVEVGKGFYVRSTWPAEPTTIRGGLSLLDARIGGNVELRNVRIEHRRRQLAAAPGKDGVWKARPALDATAARVQGDVTLACKFLGNVNLPRARIDGELRLGRKLPAAESNGREEGTEPLFLLDESERSAGASKEHRQSINLTEVEVRHSLEVARIVVTTEEEEKQNREKDEAQQRRSAYEAALERASEDRAARQDTVCAVRYRTLSFYPGWLLAEAEVRSGGRHDDERSGFVAFLVPDDRRDEDTVPSNPSSLVLLDGGSKPIHVFNGFSSGRPSATERPDPSRLRLESSMQAEDYLKFFCQFVWGEEGSFRVVEEMADLPKGAEARLEAEDAPPISLRPASARREGDAFFVEDTHIFYSGHLFRADFQVMLNGMVEMLSDAPLLDLSDLPRDTCEPPLRFGAQALPDTSADQSSRLFDLVRRAWEDPASWLSPPPELAMTTKPGRSPVEIDLTGLSAGNLDDDDGLAWWWDGKTPNKELKTGSGWEPQRRWSAACESPDPQLRLNLAGLRYGRAEKRRPESDLSSKKPDNENSGTGVGSKIGAAEMSETPPSAKATDAMNSVTQPSPPTDPLFRWGAKPDLPARETWDLISARKWWLMLQFEREPRSPTIDVLKPESPSSPSPAAQAPTKYGWEFPDGRSARRAIRRIKNALPARVTSHFCRPSGGLEPGHFNPEAYEQLARTLQGQGEFVAAREIVTERTSMDHWMNFRRARDHQMLGPDVIWQFGLTLLGRIYCKTFGYGLSSRRAVTTFAVCLMLGTVGTAIANYPAGALIIDTGVDSVAVMTSSRHEPLLGIEIFPAAHSEGQPLEKLMSATEGGVITTQPLPCGDEINVFLYAIDVFIPLLDLHQESECRVDSRRWFWDILKASYAIIGWMVTSLTILTISGVAQRKVAG